MPFIQRIHPPGDDRCEGGHGDCTAIDCLTTEDVAGDEAGQVIHPAGTVVWHSHLDAGIDPLHRLNPDHDAEDHRGEAPLPVIATPWCDACKDRLAAPIT